MKLGDMSSGRAFRRAREAHPGLAKRCREGDDDACARLAEIADDIDMERALARNWWEDDDYRDDHPEPKYDQPAPRYEGPI